MKKIMTIIAASIGFVAFISCHKASVSTSSDETFAQVETDVINDFVNNTALPQYDSLLGAATVLNNAVIALESSQTDANLQAAQAAWKNIRVFWEQSEGFLIGPVESFDYDPNTDTWPTDYTQMDALINGSQSLEV